MGTLVWALVIAWATEHALVAFGLWLWLRTPTMAPKGSRSPVEPRSPMVPAPQPPPEESPEDVRARLAVTVPGWANLPSEKQDAVMGRVVEEARRRLGR